MTRRLDRVARVAAAFGILCGTPALAGGMNSPDNMVCVASSFTAGTNNGPDLELRDVVKAGSDDALACAVCSCLSSFQNSGQVSSTTYPLVVWGTTTCPTNLLPSSTQCGVVYTGVAQYLPAPGP